MSYAAINAKLCAMNARLLKPHDLQTINQMESQDIAEWPNQSLTCLRQSITDASAHICRFITNKTERQYIAAVATGAFIEEKLHYYITQWKNLSRLNKTNRVALRGILGAEIDLNNILWMYRLKRYHRIKGDSTYGYLVPVRYRLTHETTQRMANCASPKALLDEVAKSPYASDFANLKMKDLDHGTLIGLQSEPTPEQTLAKLIDRRYQTAARQYPNSLAPAMAYLHKKQMEIQTIIAALSQAIRTVARR